MIYLTIGILFLFSASSCFIRKKDFAIRVFLYFIAISSILLLSILVGINADRADFTNYLNYFINSPKIYEKTLLSYAIHSHYETGYSLFQSLIKTIINSATVFFILFCFISLYKRFFFFKNICSVDDLLILLFSFFVHEFLRKDCVQIRNGFASAFVLVGIFYLYKGSKFKFFLYVFLAANFQMTAIVAFPLVILKTEFTNNFYKFLSFAFILSLLFSIFFPLRKILLILSGFGLIPSRVDVYLQWADYITSMKLTNPLLLKQIFFVIYIMVCKKSLLKKDNKFYFLFEVYLISTVYYLVFRDLEILAARFGSLFYGVEGPLLLIMVKRRLKNVNLAKFALLLYYLILFLYNCLSFRKFLGWNPVFY